jgi:trimeric autotransporter adhesin
MKKHHACLLVLALALTMRPAFAQNIAINTDGSLPDSNAILDIKSNSKGILIPRISSSDRLSIPATKGLLVYDSTTRSFWYNTGYRWQKISTASGSNSSGSNTATGDSTLYFNTLGYNNTATGFYALFSNTTGHGNTATGNSSLLNNTTGSKNTAAGCFALLSNTTGYSNVANGVYSLYHNTTGYANAAIGNSTLYENTTGIYNTGIGSGSLMLNDSGSFNTVLGGLSLQLNRSGNYNTAIGYMTLQKNFSGTNNTAIGTQADVGSDNLSNATALGYGAIADASNKVRIGNSAVTVIEGQVPFTTPSDGRFKFNVQEDVKGLAFITQLRPVTYQFDVKRFDAQQAGTPANTDVQWAGYNEAANMRRSGFIAQEVEKAAIASGYNFSGIIKPKTAREHYGLSYESFVVPLVKAVQELSKQVTDLQNQLKQLQESKTHSK